MAARPNVLFLFSDEHNYRYLGNRPEEEGGEPVETPTLDGLAETSTTFEQTYCQYPLCTPSRISLLTGREPQHCGAWDNNYMLPPEHETLPETFSDAGYETCLVGKMHLGGDRQFCGFDNRPYGDLTGKTGHQVDPISPVSPERKHGGVVQAERALSDPLRARTADAGVSEIPESQHQERIVAREATTFLREHTHSNPEQPWFLCASFSRPHFPVTAPARHFERYWPDGVSEPPIGREGDTADHPFTEAVVEGFRTDEIGEEERQRARAAYFACVSYLDEVLGDFLRTLEAEGFLENTIVVYASDHGELAGEHGLWWKHTWHEASTRVPLFVRLPTQYRGEMAAHEVETPVGLLDLYPTLCGLVDLEPPAELDGVDLSEAVRTGEEPDRGPVFTDNFVPRWGDGTEFRVVREGRFKYVHFRDLPDLLFDIEADPEERKNLLPEVIGEAETAAERLCAIATESVDFEQFDSWRERDWTRTRDNELSIPKGTNGNTYLLPDGRVVDAETMLYKPDILTPNPERAFADWPGKGGDSDTSE